MNSTEGGDVPKARLCIIKKWPDFNGYGFNLHAEKGKAGQFIGKVDEDSPSEAAGLFEGDRIIEINGTNIANENHQQVVQRIKAVSNETKLLVVDVKADNYYKENKILIRGDMTEYVTVQECPDMSSSPRTNSTPGPEEKDVINNNIDDEVTDTSEEVGPGPRLCHIKIWSDFAGYGFNLHAEKGKPGQFIGKVDDGSPADAAGLRQGDRIVEVNGQNLSQATHQEVVENIKTNPNETKLLVIDTEAETYYKDKNIPVTGTMSNVIVLTCPDSRPAANGSTVQADVTDDRWSGADTPSAGEEVVEVVEEEETQHVSTVETVDSIHSDEVEEERKEVVEDVAKVAAVSGDLDEVNNEGEKALADLDYSLRYADEPSDLADYDTVQSPPAIDPYADKDEDKAKDSDSDRDRNLGKVAVTGTATAVVVTSKDRDDKEEDTQASNQVKKEDEDVTVVEIKKKKVPTATLR